MKGQRKLDPTYHLKDTKRDILSHPRRENKIHILTLDSTLATDVYERIHHHPRTKTYQLIKPQKSKVKENLIEIEDMAVDTISSRLLIMDVRKTTRVKLQSTYNKIVGYNRRDFNKLCYTILIGDGPVNLFQAGKSLDVFVPHLSAHRVDYHPAVFFYDPFLHYEPNETQLQKMHEEFVLPDKIPRRFFPYFKENQDVSVDKIRRYLRAIGKPDPIKKKRLRKLRSLYKKRIAEQFPHHKDQLKAWLSREGIRLATEKLHLYPLFFEDWAFDLMQKAMKRKT
ncbi:MAG: hypothetical protein ACYSWW_21985 [Planctomycetota bacterium]|jgi:hypothetical protein